MRIPISVRIPGGFNTLLPDPKNLKLNRVYHPPTGTVFEIESVEITPDGTPIVWLRGASWVYAQELEYDDIREQFVYPREY